MPKFFVKNNQIENNVTTYHKVLGDRMFDQAYEYIRNKIVDAKHSRIVLVPLEP